MLEAYELAIKVMRLYDDIDPYSREDDIFEEALKCTADLLLEGKANEIIEDIGTWEIEPGDLYYDEAQDVLSDLAAYKPIEIWWK